jgi:hypothetical protein
MRQPAPARPHPSSEKERRDEYDSDDGSAGAAR